MEESLSVLTDAKESPEDEVLVVLVKIYLVLDRMHQLRRDGEPISSPAFYMTALKMQLDAVKQQIPPHMIQNSMSLSHRITMNSLTVRRRSNTNVPP